MANLIQWRRPQMSSLQREIEDVFDEMAAPRAIRREFDRLFDDVSSPRALWREMDRMLTDLESPPTLWSRVSRVFDRFLGADTSGLTPRARSRMSFVPNLDLVEGDTEYVMKADLPGVREQDIDIQLSNDNVMTVSGQRRGEESRRSRGYEYYERSYGSFTRSVELPMGVDASKIQADYSNGVLEIHVPKTEAARGRHIPLTRVEEPRIIGAGDGGSQQAQGKQAQQPRVS